MSTYRIKIPEAHFDTLKQAVTARYPREGAAFALAGAAELTAGIDVLIRRVVPIPDWAMQIQDGDCLRLAPAAINGLIALCEANGLGAVLCHSHPFEAPYSHTDDLGESRIAESLCQFLRRGAPVASLLFTPGGVVGRIWSLGRNTAIPTEEVTVVGTRLRRYRVGPKETIGAQDTIYDRHVRAFGEEGQRLISATKVAVVGVGGTGSPTAEQLARLGVRDILLIDPDDFEPSNLTRVYGTFADALNRRPLPRKVDLVAKHLHAIAPEAHVRIVALNVAHDDAARDLRDRDCIFLCTDDHWGRSVVNQIAHQYLVPTINVGIRISADLGTIREAIGVVDVLGPDLPCLWCRQFLDARRIAAESTPAEERRRRQQEGYIEGLETSQPSVVSLTTTAAGLAVTLFLHLVTGFMAGSGGVQRLNWDVMSGTVRRGRSERIDGCICQKVKGFGDLAPRPTFR